MFGKEKSLPQLLIASPQYCSDGDSSRLVALDGQVIKDRRGILSVRAALCRQYVVDYRALRYLCRQIAGPGLTPLLLAPGYTLVPVKTRQALVAGDPCYSYINLAGVREIKALTGEEYRCQIMTCIPDIVLNIVTSVQTVEQNIRRAQMLQDRHWQIHRQKQLPLQRVLEILLEYLDDGNNERDIKK